MYRPLGGAKSPHFFCVWGQERVCDTINSGNKQLHEVRASKVWNATMNLTRSFSQTK